MFLVNTHRHMPLFKGLKSKKKKEKINELEDLNVRRDDRRVEKLAGRLDDETQDDDGAKLVYFTVGNADDQLTETLRRLTKNKLEVSR